MARPKATQEERQARAAANGSKRGAHPEKDCIRDQNKLTDESIELQERALLIYKEHTMSLVGHMFGDFASRKPKSPKSVRLAAMSGKETSIWSDPKVAERYKLVERITGPFARCLIRQAEMHQVEETPFVILDNACGTGVVSSQLYETLDKSVTDRMQLTCGDSSEGMIQYVQKMIEDKGWKGAKAQIVDAQKTGLPSEHFTHVITNFGVMGVPDPTAALNECFRMLKPGGICALSTWDTIGWIGDVRAAFATIPGAPPFPDVESWLASWGEGAWHRATYVEQQLTAHGFVNVRVEIVPDTVTIPSPEQYYEVFSPMVQHIKTKFWSEDECERCGGSIKPALLKYLTDKYGEGRPIETNWAAILTTASKPSK